MLTNTIQPTGVYSAFQRPNSAAVSGGVQNGALNSSNAASFNQQAESAGDSSGAVAKSKKPKKTLKQRLPFLAAVAAAGSLAVIYGLPSLRRFVKIKAIKYEDAIKKHPIKNKQIKAAITKASVSVNKFIDTLENKTQKNIRKFLKTNFFNY